MSVRSHTTATVLLKIGTGSRVAKSGRFTVSTKVMVKNSGGTTCSIKSVLLSRDLGCVKSPVRLWQLRTTSGL